MLDAASAAYLEAEPPRVLVLSDIHGHCGLRRALEAARREAPVSALVLLGDAWEAGGGHGGCQEWRAMVSRLARLSGARYVVYIEGNHDGGAGRCLEGVARVVEGYYTLPGSDYAYVLTHGHLYARRELEECLWSRGFTTPESDGCVVEWGRRVRRLLGLPAGEWLILGHTHRLLVDERARVIHAGALCERVLSRLSLDWRRSLGYLVVRDSWVEIRRLAPDGRVVASTHAGPPGGAGPRRRGRGLVGRLLARLRARP
ncbi:MAG: metallophosphoesterase family protein [Desulfurococcales archaeon]|nr:metallophosphoesterase family protein [Desulfurococcales archaeon]